MRHLRRRFIRIAASLMLAAAAFPALATWHPIIEGEYFSDYDAPEAPASFNVFSARREDDRRQRLDPKTKK